MDALIHSRRPSIAPLRRRRDSGDLKTLLLLWLSLCLALPAMADPVRNVLVVYSDNRLLPANLEVDSALRESLIGAPGRPIELFTEFLDRSRFAGDAYEATTSTFLAQKYASTAPEVIVAGGEYALRFLVQNRAVMFPNVPMVFIGLSPAEIDALAPLPHDVVGVPVAFDYAGTIEQALRFHPKATRLILITGANQFDRRDEAELAREIARLNGRVSVESLAGLSMDAILQRVRALGPTDVVFTPGFFTDGAGRQFSPRESAQIIAEASHAPVYGPFNTFIGAGIVGGVMPSYGEMGRDAAALVNRILDGTSPSAIAVPASTASSLQIDWRQARRWGITEDQLPDDAIVRFKTPTFWETYGQVALIALAVMLLQTGLILALLYERRLQRRTAEALEASERRMVLAARTARLSNWIWNVASDTTANGAAMSAPSVPHAPLSKEPAAVDFDQVLEIAHPADRDALKRAVRNAVDNDEELNIEYRVVQPNQVRWFAARGRLEQGSPARLRGVAIDITQRKTAELQAEQDRTALGHMTRVSLLGQLSASIAHQLNQPLAAILSNAEAAQKMLRRDDLDLDELRAICNDIIAEDNRASQVIRRLGALYKLGERELRPVDVNELIRETLGLLHTDLVTRQVAVATHFASNLPPIEGERVQLQQVFMNLIVNAADAMTSAPEAERALSIRTRTVGTAVGVDVTDAGPGIAGDALDRIFDMFWTTKSGGMGIGLAICRTIVAAHGGTLTAANNSDKGATFRVALPARAA